MSWYESMNKRVIKCADCGVEVKTLARTRKRCDACGYARDKLMKTPRHKR